MTPFTQNVIFARVQRNQIVEYPVTYEQIKVRKLSFELFKQVYFKEKPTLKKYSKLVENLSIEKDTPVVSYEVVPFTIQDILDEIWKDKTDLKFQDIDPEAFNTIFDLTSDIISKRLNAFAKTRLYDDIVSLCSYVGDSDPQQDREGLRGRELRSLCWVAIKNFNKKVIEGSVPVPKFEDEILSVIPDLTWE